MAIRPFFFDYLVYGYADPILQDLKKKKKKLYLFFNFFFFLTFFFFLIFSCQSKARKRGGQINYGVQGTQELEPTNIAREETRHGDRMID